MKNKQYNSTKAQNNINKLYKIIEDYITEYNYSPSTRDIVKRSNLKSVSSVHSYLSEMEDLGLIYRDKNKSRSIRLCKMDANNNFDDSKYVDLPIIGDIAAGSPLLASQNINDVINLPQKLTKNANFILKTKGDSMVDAGILNGDLLFVAQQNSCDNGDIAVVLIDDEATVKRFFKEKDHIRLQPENRSMTSIIVKNCKILGKVVGVYRAI